MVRTYCPHEVHVFTENYGGWRWMFTSKRYIAADQTDKAGLIAMVLPTRSASSHTVLGRMTAHLSTTAPLRALGSGKSKGRHL
jgi:hypothetical protein